MNQYLNKNNQTIQNSGQTYNPINPIETKINYSYILKNNNISQYESQLLKHLIRFPFFKNELKTANNSSQIYKGYLVKSEIIKIFKEKYDLKKIFNTLVDNKLFDGINYNNCDFNYPKIIYFLNENNNTYLKGIKEIESSEIPYIIKPNESNISIKFINNNQSKLIYLDEFEIIDEAFYLYLQGLYKNNIQIIPVDYILIEGKIVLSIIFGQKYFYEIVNINPDGGNIIGEYLIETLINYNMINDLNPFIFQIINKNGLQKIISLGPLIKLVDNISLNIHKINGINNKKNNNTINMNNNYINKQIVQGNQNKKIVRFILNPLFIIKN